jgi:hypothetical protein
MSIIFIIQLSEMIKEKSLRIGFIGCGKMAQALAKGFIASGKKVLFDLFLCFVCRYFSLCFLSSTKFTNVFDN